MRTHYIRCITADNDQRTLPLQRVMKYLRKLFVPKKLVPFGTENPYRIKCYEWLWRVMHFTGRGSGSGASKRRRLDASLTCWEHSTSRWRQASTAPSSAVHCVQICHNRQLETARLARGIETGASDSTTNRICFTSLRIFINIFWVTSWRFSLAVARWLHYVRSCYYWDGRPSVNDTRSSTIA